MALITATEYKNFVGISTSTWDDQIDTAVNGADALIKRITDRNLEQATVTEIVSTTGTNLLKLHETPIDSITSVELLTPGTEEAAAELQGDAFAVDRENGYLVRVAGGHMHFYTRSDRVDLNPLNDDDHVWPDRPLGVRVVYVGGYETIPEDIKLAAFQLVDALLIQRRSGMLISPSQSGGGVSRSYRTMAETQNEVRALLREYIRRPAI